MIEDAGDRAGASRATSADRATFVFLAGATVLSVIFGDYAHEISKWIVCALATRDCSEISKQEAVLLGTMVSTFVAIYGTATAASVGEKKPAEARLALIGAMVGTLLALMKTTTGQAGYPEPEALKRPLIVYGVVCVVVLAPLFVSGSSTRTGTQPFSLIARTALAFFAAALLGGLFQWLVHEYWTTALDNESARKLVVAPVAPVLATAVLGTLMLGWERTDRMRTTAIAGLVVFAIVAAIAFVWIAYLPNHTAETDWITNAGISPNWIGLLYCVILLSGLVAIAIAAAMRPGPRRTGLMIVLTLFACAISFAAGYELGNARVLAGRLSPDGPLNLALVQGLAPALGLTALLCATAIGDRWGVLYYSKRKSG